MKQSEIKSVKFSKEKRTLGKHTWNEYLLSVEATVDFQLWFTECEVWIMPEGEYEFVDSDNEMHCWLDDFQNIHWLVKISTGHIQHKVVDISEKLQEYADEKYNEWLDDQERDNSKF